MIQATRGRTLAAVNTALIDLYWRVGEYIARKLESAAWGEGVVADLASYIQRSQPNLRGFTRRNLFRMRQFFDAYGKAEIVPALLAQLPWTHHLGKLEFYLEALDRDVRKPHEGPSIGVLLCASKDSEVVEYALSRSLSPALVAEYHTCLPDKKLLQAKLHEFYVLTSTSRE
ncbi:MAG TPA: PDDEXK nuclease domain-containing protein [Thermoanaerobaculia bacterium]|nr:PDDEXK nuclease domain-containing protein [Thermoanaerobaculia bacterium]